MEKFVSKNSPEMNIVLERIQKALEELPDNPRPECRGFYLAEYLAVSEILVAEKIGFVPESKLFKYLQFSVKKVTQTLFFQTNRSKNFADELLEQYAGAVSLYDDNCVGVSGHDSMIDEAIAAIWTIAREIMRRYGKENMINDKKRFFSLIHSEAKTQNDVNLPDNQWLEIISRKMAY